MSVEAKPVEPDPTLTFPTDAGMDASLYEAKRC